MFKIYAIKNCGYCKKAIEELRIRGMHFLYCPMDGPPNGPALNVTLEMIKQKYDWPTVPIIVWVSESSEKFIGGYTDLLELLNDAESSE